MLHDIAKVVYKKKTAVKTTERNGISEKQSSNNSKTIDTNTKLISTNIEDVWQPVTQYLHCKI